MSAITLNLFSMTRQAITHYRWIMFFVSIGAACATAVIVGALLVGDSVRGSMHHLVADRLGTIEHIVVARRFVDAEIANRMGKHAGYPKEFSPPIPAILFTNGTAEFNPSEKVRRASSILIIGGDASLWDVSRIRPKQIPKEREVVLNQALADDLGAKIGDEITLRMPKEQAVPADSPLGKRDDLSQSLPRLQVIDIIPNQGFGRFDLRASQKPPKNAYVASALIQKALDRDGQINALFMVRKPNSLQDDTDSFSQSLSAKSLPEAERQASQIADCMEPSLADLGLKVERVRRMFPEPGKGTQGKPKQEPKVIYDYFQLTSDQLLLPPAVVDACQKAIPASLQQPVLTYLANAIEKVEPTTGEPASTVKDISVTFSTISAIDNGPTFSIAQNLAENDKRLRNESSPAEGSVAVNSWLADRLQLKVGDLLRLYYYLPETVHGKEVERSMIVQVAEVLPLTTPTTPYTNRQAAKFDLPPTLYNDPNLTPEVPGIKDQDSIASFDLPFPLERTVPPEDDVYWRQHRLTPKLFLSLTLGQQRFGSRFGNLSSLRFDSSVAQSDEELVSKLLPELRKTTSQMGLTPIPIAWQQKSAAQGTTPFDALFLSLSFFVIIAALILISLLFRLGIEQRMPQWGLLLAMGWTPRKVRNLLILEGGLVALLGGAVGALLGIGYAYLMIWGLSGWWIGAIQIAFLRFYASPTSIVIGVAVGWIASVLAIGWTLHSLLRWSPLALLQSRQRESGRHRNARNRLSLWISVAMFLSAFLLLGLGLGLSGEARAGSFIGGAMLLVIGAVLLYHRRSMESPSGNSSRDLSMMSLAEASSRRNPIRSTLSVGMVAFASFLVLSMSLFQAKPTESASGGFAYLAESSLPIPRGLSDRDYRREVLGNQADAIENTKIVSMRVRPGDDASCSNLYQASQPRVLGIRTEMADLDSAAQKKHKFPFSAKDLPANDREMASAFAMLERVATGSKEDPIPTIIDLNTAMWSLHRGASVGEVFAFSYDDQEVHFKTVGLLQNTIMQGALIIGEGNFTRVFPSISGYQQFLLDDRDVPQKAELMSIFESGWGDEGLDMTPSATVLQSLLAVQNTYLSAFQVLGALGLLLGTFGLSVIQFRSIAERSGELALLRAVGFSSDRLARLLLIENAWLLLAGTGIGAVSAMLAVIPAWIGGQSLSDFLWPCGMLIMVVGSGLLSSLFAIPHATKLPILQALRGK